MFREGVVAIVDNDAAFIERLTEYANRRGKKGIRLAGFTSSESLREYKKTNHIMAVLCNSEEEHKLQNEEIPKLLLFERDIKRLQAADLLLEELKNRLSEDNVEKAEANLEVNVYSVFEVKRGAEIEKISYKIAEERAAKGKTILINLFPFFLCTSRSEGNRLSEVIYQLRREGGISEGIVVESRLDKCFDVLEGVDYWGDLRLISDGDIKLLVGELRKQGYKNIIIMFDLLLPAFEAILELSSNIYCSEPQSSFEESCFEEMKRQMNFSGGVFIDKLIICRARGSREYE